MMQKQQKPCLLNRMDPLWAAGSVEGLFASSRRSHPLVRVLERRLFIMFMEITWTCAASFKFTPLFDYQRTEKPIVRQLRFLMIRPLRKQGNCHENSQGFLFFFWKSSSKHILAILFPPQPRFTSVFDSLAYAVTFDTHFAILFAQLSLRFHEKSVEAEIPENFWLFNAIFMLALPFQTQVVIQR